MTDPNRLAQFRADIEASSGKAIEDLTFADIGVLLASMIARQDQTEAHLRDLQAIAEKED